MSRTRAEALPPEARRAHIAAAARPLLLEHGTSTTTRQIADAAGIAEGTIFRVFADKDALIDAVIEEVTDVTPVVDALRAVERDQPLEQRLLAAVDIVRRRICTVFEMASALGPRFVAGRAGSDEDRVAARVAAIAELFDPERDPLRVDPVRAARALHGLTIASTHPLLTSGEPLASDEIVSLLLDGIRTPPQDPAC